MCSLLSTRLPHLRTIVFLAVIVVRTAAPAGQLEAAQGNRDTPGPAEITRALDIVKADPNLAPERTVKMLRWKGATEQNPNAARPWLAWITGLFRWLEESGRMLMWVTAACLAGVLAVYILRVLRASTLSAGEPSFVPPTHVRDLDIRPESLPEDVGAAARLLWDRGEHRASLALLYRGMLSRLIHIHGLPIRHSSTEGDCLVLAGHHLSQRPREYAARLIGVWQEVVYGGANAEAAAVYVLCDRFAVTLDTATPINLFTHGQST
jgi:Domain of unknown function (DUF4129)